MYSQTMLDGIFQHGNISIGNNLKFVLQIFNATHVTETLTLNVLRGKSLLHVLRWMMKVKILGVVEYQKKNHTEILMKYAWAVCRLRLGSHLIVQPLDSSLRCIESGPNPNFGFRKHFKSVFSGQPLTGIPVYDLTAKLNGDLLKQCQREWRSNFVCTNCYNWNNGIHDPARTSINALSN